MNSNPSMAGLASLVQSRGREGDSVLVHMTPGEVKGLQALALAHGGQLTINPETGLYEANFLKKLLPTIIGFALAPLTAGTSLAFLGNPLVSGALVGGIEGLRTGDLGKGLMAGLGAFGGASLGAGLTAAAGTGAGAAGAGTSTAGLTGSELAKMGADDVLTNTIYGGLPETAAAASGAGAAGAAGAAGGAGSTFGTFGKGLQALGTQAGRSAFMGAVPGGTAGIAAGGMGIANALTPDYKQPDLSTTIDPSYYESYGYDTGEGRFLGGQWRGNYPGFPRPPGMAGGGVIPAPNGNYPLAKPSNSVGGYEIDVDPYTGEERFADGGSVGNQSLESYYQSLLAPPAQQAAPNQAFSNYLQGLNQFVTSPVAPPPKQQPPATGVAPPGAGGRPIAGGGRPPVSQPPNARFPYRGRYGGDEGDAFLNTGDMYGGGDGAMRWDANQGRFVSDAPRTPFSAGNMPSGSPFSGFGGIDFSALQRMFSGGAGASGGNMKWDADRGQFTSDEPMTNQYDQFTGDMGQGAGQGMDQGAAGTPPQDQGQQPYDFSGMDFSGLQNANFNMSGIGGSGSYMPDMSQQAQPDMGQQYQPYTGQQYAPETPETYDNPFANQQYQQYQPDMSQQYAAETPYYSSIPQFDTSAPNRTYAQAMQEYQPEYAGGTPNYDMGNQPIQEFLGTPYMPEMAYSPPTDVTNQYAPGVQAEQRYLPDIMAAETYNPRSNEQPSFSDFASQMGYTPTPAMDYNPQPMPQPSPPMDEGRFYTPLQEYFSEQIPSMPQQQAPQQAAQNPFTSDLPQPDMSSFGGFGGMPYTNQFNPAALQAPQQPMPQQPSFDMSSFSGGDMGMFAAGGPIQYAAGGKFLRGPGDGMSDDIKANINGEQEARLADGEFVIPADVVSHIGNGSSEAGADRLHEMMANIRKARTGRTRQAPEIDADKYLPA